MIDLDELLDTADSMLGDAIQMLGEVHQRLGVVDDPTGGQSPMRHMKALRRLIQTNRGPRKQHRYRMGFCERCSGTCKVSLG